MPCPISFEVYLPGHFMFVYFLFNDECDDICDCYNQQVKLQVKSKALQYTLNLNETFYLSG